MKPCFFELKAALSVFMLSVCLLACWYWQQKVTHLAGMDGWLCVCVFVCPCVCLCARACMGSWLTFRLAVLLSLDYLAAAGTLAYLLSGHLCGQARPLCPIQTLVLLTHVRTDAHTREHTHTRFLWWHSYYCDLLCPFLFWHLFSLPSFRPSSSTVAWI